MVRVGSLFSQVLRLIDRNDFSWAVRRHDAERGAKGFRCWDQLVAMLFCHMAGADSLREICGGLATALGKLVHLGLRKPPARSTLSYAIVTNLNGWSKNVVGFYNQRGTAEQWIKEGKYAVKWTRLSCHDFRDNAVRLQLFALAYNLANFMRRLALPEPVRHWSLTTLREKLVKIGAKVVQHSRYVVFQLAEVAVPRRLFAAILGRIQQLARAPT